MIKFALLAIIFFLIPKAHSEDYEIVRLPKDKSISTVMYDRGIEPIYGKKGALVKILKLNNLTEEQARKLPEFFPIKLPPFEKLGMVKRPPKTFSIEPDTKEEVLRASASRSRLGAELGYYFYQGKDHAASDFQAYGVSVNVDYLYRRDWESWSLLANPTLQVYTVQKMKSNFLTSYGLDLTARKTSGKSFMGLGGSYHRLFYIYGKNANPASLSAPIPGLHVETGHLFSSVEATLRGGMNFSAQKNQHDIGSSPFVKLILSHELKEKLSLQIHSQFEKRKFDREDQTFMSLSLGLHRFFY